MQKVMNIPSVTRSLKAQLNLRTNFVLGLSTWQKAILYKPHHNISKHSHWMSVSGPMKRRTMNSFSGYIANVTSEPGERFKIVKFLSHALVCIQPLCDNEPYRLKILTQPTTLCNSAISIFTINELYYLPTKQKMIK